jgi:16S rRNA (adenine1518-N6/adenine1519-N6)-dimethyltransferase
MSIKPKKSLGQHFLRDQQIIGKIAASLGAGASDRVIEIGPGTGALTRELARLYPDLHVFEVDQRSVQLLKQEFPDIAIYTENILHTDFTTLAQGKAQKLFITGNLPYFLTSPILFKVMDPGDLFTEAVFMIQKEVAERLVAGPGTKAYGILSVQAQVLGQVELLFTVPAHVFYPPPKVESAVIRYRPGNIHYPGSVRDLGVSLPVFKKVVRSAFQQRRKKLSNALKSMFDTGFPDDFDAGRRAEELEPHEFVALARWFEHRS